MNRDSWDLILTLHSVIQKKIRCATAVLIGTTSTFCITCTAISLWVCGFVVLVILPGCNHQEIIEILEKSSGITVITSITDNPSKTLAFALHRIYTGILKDLYSHVLIHQFPISFSSFSCLPEINTLPLLPVNATT